MFPARYDLVDFGVYRSMSNEGFRQSNSQPVDWVDLVAGIRAGDEDAVSRLRNILQGGIRFFLLRGVGPDHLQRRQREVLALVIKSIKENPVDNPKRLASHVLSILHEYIRSQAN